MGKKREFFMSYVSALILILMMIAIVFMIIWICFILLAVPVYGVEINGDSEDETAPSAPAWADLGTLPNEKWIKKPEPPIPAPRVAVVRLEVVGDFSSDVSRWLPDYISTRLYQNGWLVLERKNIDDVLAEQEFSQSEFVDPNTAVQFGKLWGLTHIIQLTVKISVRQYRLFNFLEMEVNGKPPLQAAIKINGRIIDVKTGAITAVAITGAEKQGIFSWRGYSDETRNLISKAADKAADKLVRELTELSQAASLNPGKPAELKPIPVLGQEQSVRFLGIDREIKIGRRPVTVEVSAPKETAYVIFAVYNGQKEARFYTDPVYGPAFKLIIRPEDLKEIPGPLRLEAVAFSRDNKELGKAECFIIRPRR